MASSSVSKTQTQSASRKISRAQTTESRRRFNKVVGITELPVDNPPVRIAMLFVPWISFTRDTTKSFSPLSTVRPRKVDSSAGFLTC